jgi:hypothetical protein
MKMLWSEQMVKAREMVDVFFGDDMPFSDTEERDDMVFCETEEKELIIHLKQRLEKLK